MNQNQFSGAWVSRLESAEPRLPCLHYNVVPNGDGTASCTFLPYGITANAKPANFSNLDQGFDLSAPLALMNGGNWRIVDTDYTNYAAHFVCKEADDISYHSVTIWSRPDKFVSFETVKRLKNLFSTYGISTTTLFAIYPQSPDPWCKETEEVISEGLSVLKHLTEKH